MRSIAAGLLLTLTGASSLSAQVDTTGVRLLQFLPTTTDTVGPSITLRSAVDGREYRFGVEPILTLQDVAEAFTTSVQGTDDLHVAVRLTPVSRERFQDVTGKLVGQQIGVVLAGRLVQVSIIRSGLTGPLPVTHDPLPPTEAAALVGRLNAASDRNR